MGLVLISLIMILSWIIGDEVLKFFKIDLVHVFYKIGFLSQADYQHYMNLPK